MLHALAVLGAFQGARLALDTLPAWGGLADVRRTIVLALVALSILLVAFAVRAELRASQAEAWPDGTGAFLRKGFAALVLAWLWTIFLQPMVYPAPIPRLTLAVAALFFAIARLSAESRSAWLGPRLRRGFDLAVFSLCAAVFLGEVGLRVWARVAPTPLLGHLDGNVRARMDSYRLRPGQLRMGFRTNSQGHYDEEFTARRARPERVVAIGDSFSVGVVPHAWHYTTVAEGVLGDTEILNLGIPSIGPPQYLDLLRREALPLAPDRIVIALFAGNDLEMVPAVPDPRRRLSRLLLDRRNALLFLVPSRLALVRAERARRGGDGPVGAVGSREVALAESATREETLAEMPWLEDPELERGTFSPAQHILIEVAYARRACGESLDLYEALFESLEELRRAADPIPLAVMLIPDEFQVDDVLWSEILTHLDDELLERDRFQRLVGAWLADRAVPTLDLLPHLRAAPPLEDGRPHLYHLRDTHFNARGNHLAGEALAEFLRTLP